MEFSDRYDLETHRCHIKLSICVHWKKKVIFIWDGIFWYILRKMGTLIIIYTKIYYIYYIYKQYIKTIDFSVLTKQRCSSQEHDGNTKQYNHLYLYADLLYFVNNSFGKKWLHSSMQCSYRAVPDWPTLLFVPVFSCCFFPWENSTTEFCSLTYLSPGARLSEYRSNMINDYWRVCYSTFQEHGLLNFFSNSLFIFAYCITTNCHHIRLVSVIQHSYMKRDI